MPRALWATLFLALACTILFAWHYVLYTSSVHFFSVTERSSRRLLAIVFTLLPLSLLASFFVSRWLEPSWPVRLFVGVSHLWIGVGLALILFFALAWVAWAAVSFHNPRPSPRWFGLGVLLLAAAYSGWGVVNALHPRVNQVSLHLANFPPAWHGRKIVQLSDLHLGPLLDRGFLQKVVEQVNAQNPDLIVITGDLYDGEDHDLERFNPLLDALRAPLGVYYVNGNHEVYLGLDRALQALRKTQVRILRDEMVVLDGVQLVGLAFPSAGFDREVAKALKTIPGFDPSKPAILLYHAPTQLEAAKAAGIDLQLSGHTHRGQLFPINFISRLIFGRAYHGLYRENGFTVYTSPGTGVWGPLMRTSGRSEITVLELLVG